ncbi:hypothetical protein H7F37_06350 [Winogradskyella sp. PAMC22761]|nr:hypothetical protein H7F37_06350 [Winogradskyella sp. PAMC22761]
MKKNTTYYLIFSLVSMVSFGQEMFTTTNQGDLVSLEYGNYLDLNDIQFENKSVAIDFTSLFNEPIIGFGVAYTNNKLDFEDYDRFHDYSTFEELHNVEVFVRYKKALFNNWTMDLVLAPYLSSTLNEKISREDFTLSYAANFTKVWSKEGLKSSLKLGAGYGTLLGKPNFYPLISYSSAVNENFRYKIGFPVTGVFYKLNEQSGLDFTAKPKSIYVNNASDFNLIDESYNDSKLEFKALKLAIDYKFQFDKNWSSNFGVGYLTASELTISENENTIYDFEANNSLSLNIGISLNINNK